MSQIWKKMKMKMEKSELNSRDKNFFRRKSFSIELDRIKNVGNSLQILRGTLSQEEKRVVPKCKPPRRRKRAVPKWEIFLP